MSPRGIVAKVMDFYIVVGEFELRSSYDIHLGNKTFGKGMGTLNSPAIDLIVPLLLAWENECY